MKKPHLFPHQPLVFSILTLMIGPNLVVAQCAGPTPPLPGSPASSTVQIAILAPTFGKLATFGRSVRNGIQLALDQ